MASNTKVLDNLQTAVSMELAAINQYLLHALVSDDWGLDKLAARMREEMAEERRHAEAFARRIVFLKRTPELTPAKTPTRAADLNAMFAADLADEQEAIRFYTDAARAADEAGDIGTRDLFERVALDEEGHMQWLELQLSLLEKMGEPMFMAIYLGPDESEAEGE